MDEYYKTLDLACYIVNRHNELYTDKCITHLRLQRLIYFSNLLYYIKFHSLYIENEEFIAGLYGPYLKSVYDEFISWGGSNIDPVDYYFDKTSETGSTRRVNYDESRLGSYIKYLVNFVIDLCSVFETCELNTISRSHEHYIKAREAYNNNESDDVKISNADMVEFLNNYSEDTILLNNLEKLDKIYIYALNDRDVKEYVYSYILKYGFDNNWLYDYINELSGVYYNLLFRKNRLKKLNEIRETFDTLNLIYDNFK